MLLLLVLLALSEINLMKASRINTAFTKMFEVEVLYFAKLLQTCCLGIFCVSICELYSIKFYSFVDR